MQGIQIWVSDDEGSVEGGHFFMYMFGNIVLMNLLGFFLVKIPWKCFWLKSLI